MRPLHSSSGLGLLCSAQALAAVLDVTGSAPLLLARSFAIGSTQLPWHTANLQQEHAPSLRCYRTQQQPLPKQPEPFQQLDDYATPGYADSCSSPRDATSRSRVNSRQQKRYPSSPKVLKQRHNLDNSAADFWPTYKPKTAKSASFRSARAPVAVFKPSKSARPASTHQRYQQQQHQQQQQQQDLPDLPTALGPHLSPSTAVAAPPSTAAISEGHLMSLIRSARSLGDMEKIVILYHTSFRANHVAAAATTLPQLQPESPYNKASRMRRLTALLGSAVLNVAHQMDIYQIVGCLRALTRPVCVVPLQAAALNRLIAVLLADDARKLWKLHSDDLADLAAAAAAMQLALKQQQQQARGLVLSRNQQAADQDSYNSSSSSKQHQQRLLMESPGHASDALTVPDQLAIINSSSSSSNSDALALQNPLQQLWVLLVQVAKPQLDNFSAKSLALLLHSCAAADQANDELLLLTVSAALAKSHKFSDAVTLTRMVQALALCGSSSSSRQIKSQPVQQLLHALCGLLAQNKAQYSTMQLVTCITALADLDHYSEAVCLAASKLACRSLMHWDLAQISDLLQGLVRFRYRDDLLLKAIVKHLDLDRGGQISAAAAAADVLVGLLQLGYRGSGVEEFASAVSSGLTADAAGTELTSSAAVKLLWATAVLDNNSSSISSSITTVQQLLIKRLTDYANAGQQQQQQLSEEDLRLLYQAHRLLTDQWLHGQQQQQQQHAGSSDWSDVEPEDCDLPVEDDQPALVKYVVIGNDEIDDDSSSSSSSSGVHGGSQAERDLGHHTSDQRTTAAAAVQQARRGHTLLDLDSCPTAEVIWPRNLIAEAHRAAAAHARQSAQQSRKLQQHVQDLCDQIGLDPPVQGFRVDRGALQPDLAFVAQGQGLALKVALMCDHDVRYTCNAPFELLGCETVESWLLQRAGWKVVRLPPHEWELMLQDERVHDGSALALLYNTLAAQGIPL